MPDLPELKEAVERVTADLAETCPPGSRFTYALVAKADLRLILDSLSAAEADFAEARKLVAQYAREAGEATGRLEMSEAAGIVDGWRERAEAAERRLSQAEEVIRKVEASSCNVGQILQKTREEWRAEDQWSDWDESVSVEWSDARRAALAFLNGAKS